MRFTALGAITLTLLGSFHPWCRCELKFEIVRSLVTGSGFYWTLAMCFLAIVNSVFVFSRNCFKL